jgi:hypothetical protein
MIACDPQGLVYELTVRGRLGPALRAALAPVAETTSTQLLTIVCLPGRDGQDLVDIVALLGSQGLDATTILTID